MTQTFQLGSYFPVVVDFSVKDDRRIPVVTQDRLIAAIQIDDLEAHCAQRRLASLKRAMLVGPAMRYRRRDPPGHALAHALASPRKASNSTHLNQNPRSPNRTCGSKWICDEYTTILVTSVAKSPSTSLFRAISACF